jgi:hypothetical protein
MSLERENQELTTLADVLRESFTNPGRLNHAKLVEFCNLHQDLLDSATTDEAKALLAGIEAGLLNSRFRTTGRFYSTRGAKDDLAYEWVASGPIRMAFDGSLSGIDAAQVDSFTDIDFTGHR